MADLLTTIKTPVNTPVLGQQTPAAAKLTGQKETKDVKSDDKAADRSFYERNKKGIIALGSIGAATAVILIGKKVYAGKKLTQEIKGLEASFKELLNKMNGTKNPGLVREIEEGLKHENEAYRAGVINGILEKSIVDESMASKVFESITGLKESRIDAMTNFGTTSVEKNGLFEKFYKYLKNNKKLTPAVIDDLIAKHNGSTADEKLNFADFMLNTHKESVSKKVMDEKQIDKISDLIQPIKEKDFNKFSFGYSKKSPVEVLKRDFVKLSLGETFNDESMKKVMRFLDDASCSEGIRLEFIDTVYSRHVAYKDIRKEPDYVKQLFDKVFSFKEFKCKDFNGRETTRFGLSHKLYKYLGVDNSINNKEKVDSINKMITLYRDSKAGGVSFNSFIKNDYNDLLLKRASTQTEEFMTYKNGANMDEMEKFVDGVLKDYEDALNNFEKSGFIGLTMKVSIQAQFRSFMLGANSKKTYYTFESRAKRYNKIYKKINDFEKKHFGTDSSNHNSWWNNGNNNNSNSNSNSSRDDFWSRFNNKNNRTGGSSGSSRTPFRSKARISFDEGKNTFVAHLKKHEDLKEKLEAIQREDATLKDFQRAYRALCIKYHPDKAAANGLTDEQATELIKEINNAWEKIEKNHSKLK